MSSERSLRAIFVGTTRDEILAYAFSIVGFDQLITNNDEDAIKALEKIVESREEEYALIILPERFVESTKLLREKIKGRGGVIPAFLFLPDIKEPKFRQLDELEHLLQKALGVTLKIVEK